MYITILIRRLFIFFLFLILFFNIEWILCYWLFRFVMAIVVNRISWNKNVFFSQTFNRLHCTLHITPFITTKINNCCPFIEGRYTKMSTSKTNGWTIIFMIFTICTKPLYIRMINTSLVIPILLSTIPIYFPTINTANSIRFVW
jgi:hypothetical protein